MVQNLVLNVHAQNAGRSQGALSAISGLGLGPTRREAPVVGRAKQADIPHAYVISLLIVAYPTNENYRVSL